MDKKGERGRGKGKDKRRGKEIVTSSSVFSMGPAERTMERKKGSHGTGEGGRDGMKLQLSICREHEPVRWKRRRRGRVGATQEREVSKL